MTKSSIKKYSILGLVLLVASAVTAAILPSSKNSDAKVSDGRLEPTTDGGQQTCVLGGSECTATVSDTSANGANTSFHLTTTGGGHTTA